jgi:hypothetical protein
MSTVIANVASIDPSNQNTPKEKAKTKKRGKPGPKAGEARPTKYLPTERITFTKQLDILRAWAAASGSAGKVAKNDDVAEIIGMQPSTVSMANAFFASTGLLLKAEGGYIPSPEVMSFLRAYEWTPETAATKLAPVIGKTWFAEELMPKLAYAPMTTDSAIEFLGTACSAGRDYRLQLRILLDYLGNAGLIEWDGNQVRKGSKTAIPTTATVSESGDSMKPDNAPAPAQETAKRPVPAFFGTTEGAVNFNVSVRVDMGEFANWKAERIAAFFNGMAQVLAAKAQIEKVEEVK